MGLNSPIELKMTTAGEAAKENAESIIFTRFLAGSDGSANSSSVTTIKQVIPINNYIKRVLGESYLENGISKIATESSLSISGFANSLDAPAEYVLNEIALMAKLDENGEEFCFAYDWSDTFRYQIKLDYSYPINIQYKIILSRVPQITVNTSETGVTYTDFHSHTNKIATTVPVHGFKFSNGILTVNDQVLTKACVGLGNVDNTSDLDKPISTATQSAINGITLSSLGAAAATHSHSTSDITGLSELAPASHTHVEADITDLGSYASSSHTHTTSDITDASTELAAKSHTHTESDITDLGSYASSSHTHTESDITDLGSYATTSDLNTYGISNVSFDALTQVLTLTMKDGNTKTTSIPASAGNGETVDTIVYDDANDRLIFTMSDNSIVYCDITDLVQAIGTRFDNLDTITYNNEWVERMTGTGTSADPYLIYTPRDFMKINDDLTANYKLMNNLDFSSAIGITIEINNEGYTLTTVDNEAPLFNGGEGYRPIGYNGYYPSKNESYQDNDLRNKTWAEIVALSNPYNAQSAAGYRLSGLSNNIYIFTGQFDGNGKVIKGIISNPTNLYSVALFAFAGNGAIFKNFTIKDSCFILNNVNVTTSKISSVASVVGMYDYISNTRNAVNIYNIYNYATIINNTNESGVKSYSAGIAGYGGQQYPGRIIHDCVNHGAILYSNETPQHYIAGISMYHSLSNNQDKIYNCINTSNLTGYVVAGICGNEYCGNLNINTGTLSTYTNDPYNIYPVYCFESTSYITGYQFANSAILSSLPVGDYYRINGRSSNIYYKTTSELKSAEFISEANALLSEPNLHINDLNINSGWPMLIDEYNRANGIDGDLNIAVVDPTNNKLYKSGYSVKNLQKLASWKELVPEIQGQITTYSQSNFGSMKIVNLTLAAADWDGSTSTQTKTVTGITATSPVQLLTELNADAEILAVNTNSVTFICSSTPASDINVSVMFTA